MSFIDGFEKNSHWLMLSVVVIYIVLNTVLGWKYAKVEGKRTDKMPLELTIINSVYIGIYLIATIIMSYIFMRTGNNNCECNGIQKVFIGAQVLLIIVALVVEILQVKYIVNGTMHISYVPALVTIIYIALHLIITILQQNCECKFKGIIIGSIICVIVVNILIWFFKYKHSNLSNIIDKNTNKYHIRDDSYQSKFNTYPTISKTSILVLEAVMPFIFILFLKKNNARNLDGNDLNFISVILACMYFGSTLAKIIGLIAKNLIAKPRPCAFRMAGCDISKNTALCTTSCKNCGKNSKISSCKKTCVKTKNGLTSGCLCTGKLNQFTELDNVKSNCANLSDRKVVFDKESIYGNDELSNIYTAFTSSPSNSVVISMFILFFILIFFNGGFVDKVINNSSILLILFTATCAFSILFSKIADGWNSVVDCLFGTIIGSISAYLSIYMIRIIMKNSAQ